MEVGGVGNMPLPARITNPQIYDLPRNDETAKSSGIFTQSALNYGAWCSFCHKMDSHAGKTEADSCTGGHIHGGGAF